MNKKAAKAPKEVLCYEIRDIVLGKVRGYPPWPGMVVDPETIPAVVAKERPAGKRANFYCIQFFPTGDYAWLVGKDISKLQTHEIESYINEPYKKSGDLLAGYRIALDPTKWQRTRETVESSVLEEEANAEIDQLETENEDGEPPKQAKAKKRKRESDATPAAKSKPKQTRVKKEPAEPGKKKASSVKSKKNGAKSKAMVESEDDGDHEAEGEDDEDAGPSKKASPPPLKKAKREKEDDGDDGKLTDDPEALRVREWRHKLQKTFLSNKAPPREEDMPALDILFTTVEKYDKINIQYLQFSKIGKVMRHIAVLPVERVPKNEEYNFRERAKALVDKWHQILNANKSGGSESGAANGAVVKSDVGDKEEAVTDGTAALDLNGTTEAPASLPKPISTEADAPAEDAPAEDATADGAGDVSVLADVTMSEA